MFRNNGIFRDVLLRKGGAVWDVDVQTEQTGATYSLKVRVQSFGEESLQVSLRGHGLDKILSTQGSDSSVQFDNLAVQEWTADTPNLYELYVETEKECIKTRIGFRNIRIEGRRFLVNGKAVKFHGVNHHDTSPTGGYAMTPAEIERDIKLCKEYNIDTIRTSHYPPDPYLLELCDEHGIYVVDEADVETHGSFMHKFPPNYGRITQDPFWEAHYVDRGIRLYERDKLHPCVVMWSLGNESGGYRNTDAMYRALKARTKIPIHYEGAIHSKRRPTMWAARCILLWSRCAGWGRELP
jgi:beta-galactosidase/beta-glucuronidase